MSTADAAELVGKPRVTFVDIRDPRVFAKSRVPGSIHMLDFFSYLALSTPQGVDHMTRTFEKLLRSKGVSGDERLICYEDSLRNMFGASFRGWYLLKTLGHPNVQVLEGGWQKWLREKRPVTSDPDTDREAGTFTARFDSEKWASMEDVKAIVSGANTDAKLLDVRDQVEWDGQSSSPYGVDYAPRKGRLPGAKWIEWYDFMEDSVERAGGDASGSDDEGEGSEKYDVATFKSPDAIRHLMADKGFRVDDRIVLYCFKGARASNTLSALTYAGFSNVSIYFGSWNEWSRNPDLQIESVKF